MFTQSSFFHIVEYSGLMIEFNVLDEQNAWVDWDRMH